MKVIRKGIPHKPLIPIVFYLSESKQFVDNKHYKIGNSTSNCIFMPSPNISSKWLFPVNQWITNITLTYNKEYLLNEIIEKDSYLYSLLKSGEEFYIFEPLTIELLNLINEIEKEILSKTINKLNFYSILMQILNKFLILVNEREYRQLKNKIHTKDIDNLFKVRQIILKDISSLPTIEYFAKEAEMSISKLQKSFKQVFGKSISQYALSYKMEEAKRMLSTKKYNISEVGYILGYTNLSHFSESFRKHFQINPRTFLNSLNH